MTGPRGPLGSHVMGDREKTRRFTAAQVAIDPAVARAAALTLCDRATSAEDARLLLEACGLISYRRGDFPGYSFGRQAVQS